MRYRGLAVRVGGAGRRPVQYVGAALSDPEVVRWQINVVCRLDGAEAVVTQVPLDGADAKPLQHVLVEVLVRFRVVRVEQGPAGVVGEARHHREPGDVPLRQDHGLRGGVHF